MEKNDFIKYCKILLCSISVNIEEQTSNCSNLLILKSLKLPDFITLIENENGIIFFFNTDKENVYLIKDKEIFDPPIYYNNGELFLKNSSNFFLIRLAIWISQNSSNTFSCNKYNFLKIRKYFPSWIIETYYIYELLVNTELSSFIIIKEDIISTIVAPTYNILSKILTELNIKMETQKSSPKTINIEKILDNKKIILQINNTIDKKNVKPDELIEKWLVLLSPNSINKIKIRLSTFLTKETFSQNESLSNAELNEKINSLHNELCINKIIIDKKNINIHFLAQNLFPDYIINCIVDTKLSIKEYYLEPNV